MTIERALIIAPVDKFSYTVRIPKLNKSASSVGGTPDNELYVAHVVTTAGIIPAYSKNDLIYVGFENSEESTPVILGLLLNINSDKVQSDIYATSATISTNCVLPELTTIGKITSENIKTLLNQKENIASKFGQVDKTQQLHANDIDALSQNVTEIREKLITELSETDKQLQKFISDHRDNTKVHFDDKGDYTKAKFHAHLDDTDIHFNAEGDYSKENFHNHLDNDVIHVTASDKSNWDTHRNSTDIHVTANQKDAWNTHIASTTTNVHSQLAKLTVLNDFQVNGNTKLNGTVNIDVKGAFTVNSNTAIYGGLILKENITYGSDLPDEPANGQLFFILEG